MEGITNLVDNQSVIENLDTAIESLDEAVAALKRDSEVAYAQENNQAGNNRCDAAREMQILLDNLRSGCKRIVAFMAAGN